MSFNQDKFHQKGTGIVKTYNELGVVVKIERIRSDGIIQDTWS